jgi:SAM-dependent methyltransferase/uncharacterized protein YbaR (Trm112 family)
MAMDTRLFSILSCPQCHGELIVKDGSLCCVSCGRNFLLSGNIPILIAGKDSTSAFDYIAHYEKDSASFDYFEERSGATAHSERRLREYILSLVPKDASGLLDVGCGSAWVAKSFQNSGTFVCSLDVSIENPKKAVERYPSQDHVAVIADAYHLPFQDNSFDVIIASEIIEHQHDPQAFVKELLRVIKQNGTVIISTPYKEKLVYELCIHCNQLTPHNAHLHSWDDASLRALFDDPVSGWEFKSFNNKLLLFARTYPLLQWMPFGMWKAVDKLANSVMAQPVNCVLKVVK